MPPRWGAVSAESISCPAIVTFLQDGAQFTAMASGSSLPPNYGRLFGP